MTMTRLGGVLLATFACFAAPAQAQDIGVLDRWQVAAGSYALNLGARLRVDASETRHGREFSLSHDLGMDRTRGVGYFSLGWRPFERHQLDLSHYGDDVSNSRVIDRVIDIRDRHFAVGARLRTRYAVDAYDLAYTWWLQATPRQAFGLNIGVIDYDLDIDLRAEANVSDGQSSHSGEASASTSVGVPAPKIGASYRRALGQRWRFTASASAFSASIGDIDGRVLDARAGIEYYPWSHAGMRLQYSANRIDAEVSRRDFRGHAHLDFAGLQLQVIGRL